MAMRDSAWMVGYDRSKGARRAHQRPKPLLLNLCHTPTPHVYDGRGPMTSRDLATRWRADAEVLDRNGAEQLARICRTHADEIDHALQQEADEALSLTEAAAASGYSTDRLRHMITEGKISNAGRRGAPRIRRGDLPVKPRGSTDAGAGATGFDATAAAKLMLDRSA